MAGDGESFDNLDDPFTVLLPLLFRSPLLAARALVARPVLHLTLPAAVPLTPASRAPVKVGGGLCSEQIFFDNPSHIDMAHCLAVNKTFWTGDMGNELVLRGTNSPGQYSQTHIIKFPTQPNSPLQLLHKSQKLLQLFGNQTSSSVLTRMIQKSSQVENATSCMSFTISE